MIYYYYYLVLHDGHPDYAFSVQPPLPLPLRLQREPVA